MLHLQVPSLKNDVFHNGRDYACSMDDFLCIFWKDNDEYILFDFLEDYI